MNDEPISSVGARTDREALITSVYPTYQHMAGPNRDRALGHFEQLVRAFGTYRRPGCVALSLAYVAAGRTDVALGVGVHPWDVAAGLLLVRKAGGHYRSLPLSERPDPWMERGYVATVGTFDFASSVLQGIVEDLS